MPCTDLMYASAGRDLSFLLGSYGINAAVVLSLLAYLTRRQAGVTGIWACLLLFQVRYLSVFLWPATAVGLASNSKAAGGMASKLSVLDSIAAACTASPWPKIELEQPMQVGTDSTVNTSRDRVHSESIIAMSRLMSALFLCKSAIVMTIRLAFSSCRVPFSHAY